MKENLNQRQFFEIIGEKPIAFNPAFARLTGSINAGLLLSQLLYWSDKGKDPEWFYKTIAEIQGETALTRSEQDTAIRKLKALGLIEVKVMGVPAKRHFRLSLSVLYKLVCRFYANKNAENKQTITDITTDITSNNVSKDTGASHLEKRNIGTKIVGSGTLVVGGKKTSEYGNQDINKILAYMKERLGLPVLDGTEAQNRRYAYNLLRKFGGLDKCLLMIDAISLNEFWRFKITSMKPLFYNGVRILSELREKDSKILYVKNE